MSTFILSIETAPGKAMQYPWHFGTIEHIARACALAVYRDRVKAGLPTYTIALIRDCKIFDVFDGAEWHSVAVAKWFSETE